MKWATWATWASPVLLVFALSWAAPGCGGEDAGVPPATLSGEELDAQRDEFLARRRSVAETTLQGQLEGIDALVARLQAALPSRPEAARQPMAGRLSESAAVAARLRELLETLRASDATSWEARHTDLMQRVRELGDAVDGLERQLGG